MLSSWEIKGKMIMAGKPLCEIAAEAQVSRSAVSRIVWRKARSARVQRIIARHLGMGFEEVWGESA